MAGKCKGVCEPYKAPLPYHSSRYDANQVRCRVCSIFLTQEGVPDGKHCICCGYQVSRKPSGSRYSKLHGTRMFKS